MDEDLEYWSRNFIFPPSFKVQVCWMFYPPTNDILSVIVSSPNRLIRPATIKIESPLCSVPSSLAVSCEYLIFSNCFDDVIDGIRFDVKRVCILLHSKCLIAKDVCDYVFNDRPTEAEKATKVFFALSNSIKEDPNNFLFFLNSLSNDVYANTKRYNFKEPLTTLYSKLYEAYQANVISSLTKPFRLHQEYIVSVIRSTSYGLRNVITFLDQFGISVSADSVESLISEIISNLKRSRDPHRMFFDVCASVTKAGVNTLSKKLRGM